LPVLVLLLLALARLIGHVLGVGYTYRGLVLWDMWLLGVVVCFGPALVRVWKSPAESGVRPRWLPLWSLPLVVVLNGLSPYLGLKTETSWSMYSNLRTEVNRNHFIAPASAQLFGYQSDLVEVLESSLPAFEKFLDGEVKLTFFEFRRTCSSATGDFFVRYRRDGGEGTFAVVDGVASDPELCRAHPWPVAKLLLFRPVDTGAHASCRH
jgi:hypothetical protein